MRNIVSDVVFKTRVRDETIEEDNPYNCVDETSENILKELNQL